GHAGHALDTAGDDHVIAARDHALGREVYGLLAGSALAIHGGGGHRFRKPRRKHGIARDVYTLLAYLHYATANHVFDQPGIEPVALHQPAQRMGQQVYRMPFFEHAIASPHRRAYRIHDYCFTRVHVSTFDDSWWQREQSALSSRVGFTLGLL